MKNIFFSNRFFFHYITAFFLCLMIPSGNLNAAEESMPTMNECMQEAGLAYTRGQISYVVWLEQYQTCLIESGQTLAAPQQAYTIRDEEASLIACTSETNQWYTQEIQGCLANVAEHALNARDDIELEKLRQTCYEGAATQRYTQQLGLCYDLYTQSGSSIWKLPVLQETLRNQFTQYRTLSLESGLQLSACIEDINQQFDLSTVTAEIQTALSRCFKAVGMDGPALVYEQTAIVVDCAKERISFENFDDLTRVFTHEAREDTAYIEQCVVKRLVPIAAGLALVNIPLVAGPQQVLILLQFLWTQALLLLRRRRYSPWGRVFDATTREPVDLSVVRLYDHANGKILSTAVTDRQGQYFFLPLPGLYRMEAAKSGYVFPSKLGEAPPPSHHIRYYVGGKIDIHSKEEVVDHQIPLDPQVNKASVQRFRLGQWKNRVTWSIAYSAPLISWISALVVRRLWVLLFAVVHVLILLVFLRLNKKIKLKKFGIVKTDLKKALSGVVVSLFRREDSKLLCYYVTDMYGRYFFPRLTGNFVLVFEKSGYHKKQLILTSHDLEKAGGVDFSRDISMSKLDFEKRV